MTLDIASIAAFYKASQLPHATGTAQIERRADGSKRIRFERGEWSSEDVFFGGEPYAGQVIIAQRGRPVWSLVYYGSVCDSQYEVPRVYAFLRVALRTPAPELPVRGPAHWVADGLEYRNQWQGDFAAFSGRERIEAQGREIYWASYAGGWVDRRASSAE
jgi:hypothetical protein